MAQGRSAPPRAGRPVMLDLAQRLGLVKVADGSLAGPCPACGYGRMAFSIKTVGGRQHLTCGAGCTTQALVRALRRLDLDVPDDAVHWTDPGRERKQRGARRIWASASPAEDTPVEKYLHRRGLLRPIPADLRYAIVKNWREGKRYHSMVAAVRDLDGEQVAVHITSLFEDGSRPPIDHPKLMLGPVRGNAAHITKLDQVNETLCLAEGIETALSVERLTGLPCWACLSASGLRNAKVPDSVATAILAADGDSVGRRAARDAFARFRKEGREAEVRIAPAGRDFNDVLQGKA